jgi:hypothetical protein
MIWKFLIVKIALLQIFDLFFKDLKVRTFASLSLVIFFITNTQLSFEKTKTGLSQNFTLLHFREFQGKLLLV